EVIERSVSRIPSGVHRQSGGEIIRKLKSRRDMLATAAYQYYHILEKEVPYNKYGLIPSVDYNASDLVFLGLTYQIKSRTLKENTLVNNQRITGNYALKTGAYVLRYMAEFYSFLSPHTDLIIKSSFNGPKYTSNYY